MEDEYGIHFQEKSIESADILEILRTSNTRKVTTANLIIEILMEDQSDCVMRRHPAVSS
jgi:hypothetical protein